MGLNYYRYLIKNQNIGRCYVGSLTLIVPNGSIEEKGCFFNLWNDPVSLENSVDYRGAVKTCNSGAPHCYMEGTRGLNTQAVSSLESHAFHELNPGLKQLP